MSNTTRFLFAAVSVALLTVGCSYFENSRLGTRYFKKADNVLLGRDHVKTHREPVLQIARCITKFEDDLRRDGTITAKVPDVWTDSNLMHSIQEFDQEMESTLSKFSETIQAYISESDREGFLSELAVISESSAPRVSSTAGTGAQAKSSATSLLGSENLKINAANEIFGALKAIQGAATPKGEFRLEPTARERQHATYVDVNQSLRRRKMGGDNIRRPGYGLYMFRIPVSVIPGEETSKGYSAVANFRARMVITPADVKYSLPRMAIAELVDVVAPNVLEIWNDKPKANKAKDDGMGAGGKKGTDKNKVVHAVVDGSKPRHGINSLLDRDQQKDVAVGAGIDGFSGAAGQGEGSPEDSGLLGTKFRPEDYQAIRDYYKKIIGSEKPNIHELRAQLFDMFLQITIHLQELRLNAVDELNAFDIIVPLPGGTEGEYVNAIQCEAKHLEIGDYYSGIRRDWDTKFRTHAPAQSEEYFDVSWLVARHCGLTDLNIKRLIKSMVHRRQFTEDFYQRADAVNFFSGSTPMLDEAAEVWQALIEKQFPLQVFNLEPIIEEQNLLDSQSRLRQMQVALAYSVANGGWNVAQRVQLARELARDSASIGVNRTIVGFVHGMDTFGWYFNPRVQSPDRVNRGVVLNNLFPQTRSEDAKTYRLEPGIRECEVLIAMPSFVTQVGFDVTTNWERLSKPGKGKRSYEELIAEGCKLQDLRAYLCGKECVAECRPGDLARLTSRIDQLEAMLGLQTHVVEVPYDYDHPAGELFSEGERSLRPVIYACHGLTKLTSREKVDDKTEQIVAEFFVSGKNFHPTLTHVVVGGHEFDTIGGADPEVEIISRQLIRVRAKMRSDLLSSDKSFEVRVGTPSGMSNPATIDKAAKAKAIVTPKVASLFDWETLPEFEYHTFAGEIPQPTPTLKVTKSASNYLVQLGAKNPMDKNQFADAFQRIRVKLSYETTFEDKSTSSYKESPLRPLWTFPGNSLGVTHAQLATWIEDDLKQAIQLPEHKKADIKVTFHLMIDDWPMEKMDKTITIKLIPKPE